VLNRGGGHKSRNEGRLERKNQGKIKIRNGGKKRFGTMLPQRVGEHTISFRGMEQLLRGLNCSTAGRMWTKIRSAGEKGCGCRFAKTERKKRTGQKERKVKHEKGKGEKNRDCSSWTKG